MRYLQSGYSAAWLARLSGGQKVASSNLAIPTIFFVLCNPVLYDWIFLCLDFTQRTTGIYSTNPPEQRTNRERQILSKSITSDKLRTFDGLEA